MLQVIMTLLALSLGAAPVALHAAESAPAKPVTAKSAKRLDSLGGGRACAHEGTGQANAGCCGGMGQAVSGMGCCRMAATAMHDHAPPSRPDDVAERLRVLEERVETLQKLLAQQPTKG